MRTLASEMKGSAAFYGITVWPCIIAIVANAFHIIDTPGTAVYLAGYIMFGLPAFLALDVIWHVASRVFRRRG